MAFKRKARKTSGDEATAAAAGTEPEASDSEPAEAPRPGALDASEVTDTSGHLDFGGLLIPVFPDIAIRLDQDSATRRFVAVTIMRGDRTMRLRPFAAPRSGGMWEQNRSTILDQVAEQGGTVREIDGRYGPELLSELHVPNAKGTGSTKRAVRFAGVEGPRWLLHVMFTSDLPGEQDWDGLEEVLASVVVVRGDEAMPAGAMLTLQPPPEAQKAQGQPAAPGGPTMESLEPGQRITEVR